MSATATQPETPTSGTPPRANPWPARLGRIALAVAAGLVLYLSFAPRPLWWLAPFAFAGLAVALHGRRFWSGLGVGFAFGLTFFLTHLRWIQDFLGDDFGAAPWLALSALMALFLALACGLMTLVATLPAAPVWMALVFLLHETVRGRFPINGFPWGRTAFSQPEGAYLPLAAIGGAPLVGFAVVVTGFGLGALVVRLAAHGGPRPRALAVPVLCALLPAGAGLALWPTIGTDAESGSRTVAIVQGNAPDAGLGLLGQTRTIRANHIAQTERLIADIRSGAVPKPDLVVWPETATDVRGDDPVIDRLVDELDTPALIGAKYRLPTGRTQNTVVAWEPGTGQDGRYAKQELVPFAEYVPLRSLARLFTPFVDDTGDMQEGTGPANLDVADTSVGVAICYEAAYDYVSREATAAGARLLTVPTNNAWYGPGEMSYQQLAMSRLRAVEHGRAVVVPATSGVSALVAPDGTVDRPTQLYTAATLVGTVPLREQTTLSDRLGAWTEYVLVGGALAALLTGIGLRLRTRRTRAGQAPQTATD
ncbi:apolipoprotein N-acyltransferase [Amycolatopsis antarctica]|uniref:Apolipoprotein N-acyltransferase n=1 Tax=Amycolatopsis antarctica TaxID=1854586 RepID=A0A263D390_9PSEU|nr:apolipoprotein N-acyltransferase [Amycolatopsis antarctica]OZM72933.1 apolipoprotein N-acyltransferase [Amycolatopsis antarctica]